MIVYTAVFDGYDTLRAVKYPDVEHVCFTDEPQGAEGWTELVVPHTRSGKLDSLYYKCLAHRWFDDDVVIWHDACGQLKQHPSVLGDLLGNADLAAFAHPTRNCIYDEADAVIAYGKGEPSTIQAQVSQYRKAGYPEHAGLSATGLLVRRQLPEFNEQWWWWCRNLCPRDQLSFNYLVWKEWLSLTTIPSQGVTYDYVGPNDYIDFRGHNE